MLIPARRRALAVALVAVVAAGATAVGVAGPAAHATDPGIALVQVANIPKAIVMATRRATGASYVGTQDGRVYLLRPGKKPRLALDMRGYTRAKGEQGLLGLAFHPTLPYVYVSHTSLAGSSRLAEYVVRADGTFRPSSRRLVLSLAQPYPNHKGGNVAFGPDGYLYMGFGDGGSAGDPDRHALDLHTWLGKIIRIDPRRRGRKAYSVPADNPFVGVVGAKPEIWSIGLRNPWRWSFDPATGDLWIGDVGQDAEEEVDLARAVDGRGRGVSFGWSAWEGTDRYNADQPADGSQLPLYEYTHADGCAITGGVVDHDGATPSLQGAYLFADWCSGEIHQLTLDGGGQPTVSLVMTVANPVSFGTDAAGHVYVIAQAGGVYRLVPAA